MRILHVYRTYFPDPPGGIQEVIRQLCLSTKELGAQSRVFTFSPNPKPEVIELPETTVIRAKSIAAPASCDISGPQAFLEFSKQAAWADVINLHYPWPFLDLLRFVAPSSKPCVLSYHSDIVRQKLLGKLYAPLMKNTFNTVDAIVANTPTYFETSTVLQSIKPAEKIKVIPYGMVDRAQQTENEYLSKSTDILARYGLKEGEYFLSLGVMRYYKGLHTLVQAAPKIDAPIVIAGSGPEEVRLRVLAAEVGANNIHFTGQATEEEKFQLIRGCRAFILPSHLRSESFGMVLIEAMMISKPIICCDIGSGPSYINQNNVTGIHIPPESPHELTLAMKSLWTDQSLADRMGRAARERFLQFFTAETMGKSYLDLYQQLVMKKSRT